MLTKERIKKPRIVGYWAILITPQQDMLKFGQDGNVVFPHKRPREALAACRNLKVHEPDCRCYILRVFNNGQMKTFDYE